jgi:hypothetical protein
VYLLNRSPTKSLDGKTAYEAWHGKKPAVDHLRTFNCVVYAKETCPQLKKLEDRSTPMVFLGYNERTKGYRVFDPARCHVISIRDTIFDEVVS